jgi:hypothetical protein
MVAGFLAEGALIGQVSSQLVQLLSLRSWIFQYGVAGLGRPARLQRDGSVTFGQLRWAADGEGLPAEGDVELLVESGGSFQGRFSLDRSTRDLRPTVHRCALSTAIVTRLAVRPAGPMCLLRSGVSVLEDGRAYGGGCPDGGDGGQEDVLGEGGEDLVGHPEDHAEGNRHAACCGG